MIRPATVEDRSDIWAILEPIFRAGETYCIDCDVSEADGLEYWLGGSHSGFVCEEDGQVLGTYFICPNNAGGGSHVCNCGFATALDANGKGVARRMLNHALLTAKQTEYRSMQFNFVISSNTRAIQIWHTNGFETVGTLPKAFNHPNLGLIDAYVMFKDL